jgi:type I site-specific restriction-modification system R (restriction) subunit
MAEEEDNEVYRVIMDGYILADASKFQVIRKLKRLFGTTEQKILEMIDGQPTIIKHQLPKRQAYQYVRTITNAGAACHIDKWVNFNLEETTQLPVHIERSRLIQNSDSLDRVNKIVQHSTFSDEMRQEILEMTEMRKKSDVVISSLFIFLLLLLSGAAIYLLLL